MRLAKPPMNQVWGGFGCGGSSNKWRQTSSLAFRTWATANRAGMEIDEVGIAGQHMLHRTADGPDFGESGTAGVWLGQQGMSAIA
jgi:hypothetical protein